MTATACAIYARISQDREGAGLGVDRQERECRELAARLGWTVAEVFTDNDLSAYSGKPRPGYRALLQAIRDGRITSILAWHTDRLHRSPAELEEFIGVCDPRGVVTHTVRAGLLDLSTPSGRMVARQLGAVARFESEHKSDRVRTARRDAALAGRWQGGARPFGFEADGTTIRPSEAAEIVKATNVLLAGGSLRSVVHDLNQRGVKTTFNADEWSTISFRDVLLRPRNAGLVVYRGEVLEGVKAEWQPIISEAAWRALVAMLTDPSRRTNGGNNRVRWLGSGLYVCGTCEQPRLRVSTAGGKRKPAYRCATRDRERTTGHVVRDAAAVDQVVEAVLVERLSRPDAANLVARRPSPTVDTGALHIEAASVRHKLDELDDDLDSGVITRARWLRRNERLRERLDEITHQIANAAKVDPLAGVVGAEDVVRVWFGTKSDRSDGLDLGRRRAILDAVATVTIEKTGAGRPANGAYFDPTSIRFDWKADQ